MSCWVSKNSNPKFCMLLYKKIPIFFFSIFETTCKYQYLLLVVYWKEKLKWETEVVTFFTIFRSDVFAGSVFWWNISHFWYWGHFICRPGPRGQDWSHGLHFSQVRQNLLHINLQQFSPWMKKEIASNFILQKRIKDFQSHWNMEIKVGKHTKCFMDVNSNLSRATVL